MLQSNVRGLIGDEELLEGGILNALAEYNTEELATVIVSKFGLVENDRFLHPKTNKVFKLDHVRQMASDPEDHTMDEEIEELRKAVEKSAEEYVADRFSEGVVAVYGSKGVITIAIVHNKYSPSNFWNGRWRSIWRLDTSTSELKGTLRCKVHYYEDGNVQLETSKEIEEKLTKGASDPHKEIAKTLMETIGELELKYQTVLNESYNEMSESTFSGLRRALPFTRTKIDWNKLDFAQHSRLVTLATNFFETSISFNSFNTTSAMSDREQHSSHSSTPVSENDGGDDIWDDSDNVLYDRSIAEREWSRLHDTFGNTGYREGIEEGKEGTLQQGFNQGWTEGVHPLIEYLQSTTPPTLSSSTSLPSSASSLFTISLQAKEAWIKRARELVKELIKLDIVNVFDKAYFDDGHKTPSKSVSTNATTITTATANTGSECCKGSSSPNNESCCRRGAEIEQDDTNEPYSSSSPAGEKNRCSSKKAATADSKEGSSRKPDQLVANYRSRVGDLLNEIGLLSLLVVAEGHTPSL
ncbi:F-actin-capping protein [Modicella reniformis]|uniref:F-actin-capping protein subunit alpha n=1 Tax=Modicella reniformis TaxID=1440133 RepID=A0A9P6SPH8_9FUNG|nr:F-actin-capping protein [Modicella reniformis]